MSRYQLAIAELATFVERIVRLFLGFRRIGLV